MSAALREEGGTPIDPMATQDRLLHGAGFDQLVEALDEMDVPIEAIRPRNGRDLAMAEGDLSMAERDRLRRERRAAAAIMLRGHQDNDPAWCMGVQVTTGIREHAIIHARDNHTDLAQALVEVCRARADGLRLQSEMARRRVRMEHEEQDRPVNQPQIRHPVKRILDAYIKSRGDAYTSTKIIESGLVSRDVSDFLHVVAEVVKQYGNLDELPRHADLQFSLNFTPRMDILYPSITINMMAPIEVKLVLWTEPDGSWNVRHNVVGAKDCRLNPIIPLETTAPVINNQGPLYGEEIGKQGRSIQLD